MVWSVAAESRDPRIAQRLFHALSRDFEVAMFRDRRLFTHARLSVMFDPDCRAVASLASVKSLEPHVFWQEGWLEQRVTCYRQHQDPLLVDAEADLRRFKGNARESLLGSLDME